MKYIKYFESLKSIDFTDIYDILIGVEDEGYDIFIFAANGFGFNLSDIEDENKIKTFRFNRYQNDSKKSFKFRVDFKQPKNYSELVDFLSMMNTEIARFNDLGFYLQYLDIDTDKEGDRYSAYSAEFNMES